MTSNCKSRKQCRKIAELKFPVHRLAAILEYHPMLPQNLFQMIFVTTEVAEVGGMFQRKLQRFQRVIKAHDPDLAGDVPRGAEHGKRVGGRAEANVPDHKFASMILEAFAQAQLVDVERLRLGNRADDRMKRLGVRERTHGADAVVQADELVVVQHEKSQSASRRFQIQNFHLLDSVIRPEDNGMASDDKNLQEPADIVVLDVIALQKRIGAEFVEEPEQAFALGGFQARKGFGNAGFHIDRIGNHFRARRLNDFCKSSSRTQCFGVRSSMRRVISVRQAGSSRNRKCRRNAASLFWRTRGQSATSRITSAMLMVEKLHCRRLLASRRK